MTWWLLPCGAAVALPGRENAHWEHAARHAGFAGADAGLAAQIQAGGGRDEDALAALKAEAFAAGWIRLGLVDGRFGPGGGASGYSHAGSGRGRRAGGRWLRGEAERHGTALRAVEAMCAELPEDGDGTVGWTVSEPRLGRWLAGSASATPRRGR